MQTRITEISDGLYRLSTLVPEIAPPAGFTFNQFLLMADEPLLFHCGHKGMFDSIRDAVEKIMPVAKLRWISFSHYEADECGAMNLWQEAAPHAQVLHGQLGCAISLNDQSVRAPRPMQDNEVLDLGGRRIRYLATPHVPHGWDAGLIYEETNGTLLCSDLLGQVGDGPALTERDIVGPALDGENLWHSMSVTPDWVATLHRLASLEPRTLAIMHGSSFTGAAAATLRAFADGMAKQRLPAAA
jgi:flavorubredoxin